MAQSATVVENNFKNGLITEATGLNFPESACTDTYDCEFNYDGSVSRRLGFDYESNATTKNIDRSNRAVVTYRWRNVAGDGNTTLVVMQVGPTIYFYKTNGASVSAGAVASTVTLTPVTNAPIPDAVEAQFSDGNGFLFITHPSCEPMRVAYDTSSDTATATNIILQIRDFEGATADVLAVDARPTASLSTVNKNHLYNLYNQGWGLDNVNLTAWDTARTDMPSNADVMWAFKNSSDAFDASTVPNVIAGNTPAPKGHFVLNLYTQDRATAAGTTGVATTSLEPNRPSTSAFFAGRVFYSGINTSTQGANSSIYFTQIVERPDQYAATYQINDPTSEDEFDLLPSDGGVIKINECGTVIKLFVIPGGMLVFATNGIWFITGSTGLGFSATDYTVQRVSTLPTLTASSFVDVNGSPAWWTLDGIYMINVQGQGGLPSIQSLTIGKIKTFFDDIPTSSKQKAKGFFHTINGKIEWLFRSTDTQQITNLYEYDRILNFNTYTGAFYPWTVTSSPVKMHAIVVLDSLSGSISINNVVDASANNVQDASGNQVIAFSSAAAVGSAAHKYVVSSPNGSTYAFTFAEEINTDCVDWFQFDTTGVSYNSYFVTGYKIRGEGLRLFQPNWVSVFSRFDDDVLSLNDSNSYYFQGLWNYALTGSGTGQWGTRQYVSHLYDGKYAYKTRRLRVRGHGTVLQFKVQSVNNNYFDIIGWSSMDICNQLP